MSNKLLSTPPLDAVRGFVAVARRMSITLAAQDLCLTQSAVSRQIQVLEQHFGQPLLLRKHRAIELTTAGEQLFHLASPWLDRLVDFTESIRQSEQVRPVTITASIGATSLWLLPRLGTFQSAHPHIDVRVAADNRVQDLRREDLDLAIRYCRAADAPPGALRLFGEQVMPVAHKSIAAEAFKNEKSLFDQVFLELDERALPWLRWADWLQAAGYADRKPKAYLHFNQYDQIIHAALEGHGVALGRISLVLPMIRDGRLVTQPGVMVGDSDYCYWLVDSPAARRREVEVFRDWIVKEAKETEDFAKQNLAKLRVKGG